jgi:hypothetical protein
MEEVSARGARLAARLKPAMERELAARGFPGEVRVMASAGRIEICSAEPALCRAELGAPGVVPRPVLADAVRAALSTIREDAT